MPKKSNDKYYALANHTGATKINIYFTADNLGWDVLSVRIPEPSILTFMNLDNHVI